MLSQTIIKIMGVISQEVFIMSERNLIGSAYIKASRLFHVPSFHNFTTGVVLMTTT